MARWRLAGGPARARPASLPSKLDKLVDVKHTFHVKETRHVSTGLDPAARPTGVRRTVMKSFAAIREMSLSARIAAVILESAPANMGIVPPVPGFNESVRRVTAAHGALMIADEVLTAHSRSHPLTHPMTSLVGTGK